MTNAYFFFYGETNRRPWLEQVSRGAKCLPVQVSEVATFEELIEQASKEGMPKGSSRSGCFEIQTAAGVHRRVDGRGYGRLTDPSGARGSKVEFVTWDELEAQEG